MSLRSLLGRGVAEHRSYPADRWSVLHGKHDLGIKRAKGCRHEIAEVVEVRRQRTSQTAVDVAVPCHCAPQHKSHIFKWHFYQTNQINNLK